MSRLEELIAELCPNGVEYKRLADICNRQKGIAITAGEMKELDTPSGDIRIFAAGNTIANVNYEDIPAASVITIPSVIVKSRGNIGFEYYDKPFTHKNEMWSYSSKDKNINIKFVYYFLDNHINEFQVKAKTGKLPQISTPDTDNYKIPVPPLPVQEEIVRILDTFSELTAELTAELTKRKQQYQYYRDSLLDFSDDNDNKSNQIKRLINELCPNGVEYKLFGEVATIARGASPRPIHKYITDNEDGVNWIKIGDVAVGSKYVTETKERITPEGAKHSRFVRKGDFILSNSMSFGRPYIMKTSGCIHDGWLSISNFEKFYLSDFLYHLLNANFVQRIMLHKASSGTVSNLNADIVKSLKLPVPPLPIQEEIVRVLDRFDALCNDLTNGLPAEIEARKKQYEYYRDKLLTFKEAV